MSELFAAAHDIRWILWFILGLGMIAAFLIWAWDDSEDEQ